MLYNSNCYAVIGTQCDPNKATRATLSQETSDFSMHVQNIKYCMNGIEGCSDIKPFYIGERSMRWTINEVIACQEEQEGLAIFPQLHVHLQT